MSAIAQHVRLRLFAAARSAAGVSELWVTPGSVEDVLAAAVQEAPGLAEVLPRCSLLLDGVAVHDRSTPVPEGSDLDVLPPFAGG